MEIILRLRGHQRAIERASKSRGRFCLLRKYFDPW